MLGTGVRVAVVDTGIDYLHPDLAANFAGGYDFVNNDADPMDDNGHGTHVSGTIAAVRNGTGVLGAAPEADLFALKVLGSSGSGSWSGILSALDWCAANRVAVANFSLGSSSYPGTTVEAGFDNAAKAGVLLVAAAGNSGAGTDTVNYPGKFASVIAVGSTTSTDLVSSFSSTGPDVELAAPGSLIYSTTLGGGYGTLSGTSMATPHVTGVAALVVAAGIGDANGDGFINDDVRQLLQSTAQDLGAAGRDPIYGFGLVDAEAAVAAVQGAPTQPNPVPIFNAPSNLQATVSGKTVSLSWVDNSNVETGYEVQIGRWKGRGLTWSVWNVTGTDVSTLSGSLGKGTYSFRVRGMTGNPVVYTAVSNEVTVTLR
ncbi:MAG: peptidase S8 [Proteobacteria bacterium]|nr:peptidase S8 [Pseudomonadota bacterium]